MLDVYSTKTILWYDWVGPSLLTGDMQVTPNVTGAWTGSPEGYAHKISSDTF